MPALLASLALAAAPCLAALCGAEHLAGVPLSTAQMPTDRPVHIVQIGDSHTAGDAITGALRDALQARLGNGGRGLMPAGRPHAGVRLRGVSVSPSGPWSVRGLFGSGAAESWPPRGITGYTVSSHTPGAALALTADGSFTAFGLCVMASSDGTRLNLTLGTDTQELAFAGEGPQCRRIVPGAATYSARLESQLQFLGRADEATIAAQFQALPADLVILAFGTNEGFAPFFDPTRLESQIREQVARIRRLAGPVPILLLGPPDAASRNTELRNNVVGGAPAAEDCNRAIQATPGRLPVDGIDIPLWNDEGGTLAPDPVTLSGPMPRAVRRGLPLFNPPALAAANAVQRRVAADLGIAFWDWRARQGGACSAVRWMQAGLMGPDFIHYSPAGGAEVARLLLADLDAARVGGLH
jgi:lysophospholipase L1-like esterase